MHFCNLLFFTRYFNMLAMLLGSLVKFCLFIQTSFVLLANAFVVRIFAIVNMCKQHMFDYISNFFYRQSE